jgi:hypothetical protein
VVKTGRLVGEIPGKEVAVPVEGAGGPGGRKDR